MGLAYGIGKLLQTLGGRVQQDREWNRQQNASDREEQRNYLGTILNAVKDDPEAIGAVLNKIAEFQQISGTDSKAREQRKSFIAGLPEFLQGGRTVTEQKYQGPPVDPISGIIGGVQSVGVEPGQEQTEQGVERLQTATRPRTVTTPVQTNKPILMPYAERMKREAEKVKLLTEAEYGARTPFEIEKARAAEEERRITRNATNEQNFQNAIKKLDHKYQQTLNKEYDTLISTYTRSGMGHEEAREKALSYMTQKLEDDQNKRSLNLTGLANRNSESLVRIRNMESQITYRIGMLEQGNDRIALQRAQHQTLPIRMKITNLSVEANRLTNLIAQAAMYPDQNFDTSQAQQRLADIEGQIGELENQLGNVFGEKTLDTGAKQLKAQFDAAIQSGDKDRARIVGQQLKDQYGWESGIGDGGWPYVKAPVGNMTLRPKQPPATGSSGGGLRRRSITLNGKTYSKGDIITMPDGSRKKIIGITNSGVETEPVQ